MRDESISKAVIMIGSLIGAIVVVGIIVAIVYLTKDKVDEASNVMIGQANDAIESTYTQYDGDIVTGSEVLSAIGKFKSDTIFVAVNNGKATTYYYKNADGSDNTNTVALAKKKSDLSHYINPSANFLGAVTRDADTGTITGITFTKQ